MEFLTILGFVSEHSASVGTLLEFAKNILFWSFPFLVGLQFLVMPYP